MKQFGRCCIHINRENFFRYLVVFTLLLSSGANPLIRSIYVFFICSVIYALYRFKGNVRNVLIMVALLAYIWVDSCLLNTAPTDYKECILLTVRICCCYIVATNVPLDKFREAFIHIMSVLAPVSLIIFLIYLLFRTLPGISYVDGWMGTFYQTIGYGTIDQEPHRIRNCGIFTEPGVYQLYLNTALLALISERKLPPKKVKVLFWLFTITLLSTRSSMGYLLYACVLVVIYIERKELLPLPAKVGRSTRVKLIVTVFVCAAILEVATGMLNTFVRGTNSWASRHDDTLLTFLMARDYPLFGLGLATDMLKIWDRYYKMYGHLRIYKAYQNARSCGLGNYMAMGGIPFAVLYLFAIVKMFLGMFNVRSIISKCMVSVILIMFTLEEPLLPTPMFLLAFYYCYGSVKNTKCVQSNMELKQQYVTKFE